MSSRKNVTYFLVALIGSLTLGLAPFIPEPHVVGKWRWLLGGAKGMKFMDYFDLILHSLPFILLLFMTIKLLPIRRRD